MSTGKQRGLSSPEPLGQNRYPTDVLAGDWKAPRHGRSIEVEALPGMVVEEVSDDFVGEIIRVERDLGTLILEDRRQRRRTFPLGPGFWLEGKPVTLIAPRTRPMPSTPKQTASGSIAVSGTRARVARESRIFVEGRHDAELVEKIWGDDLRVEGVVVEYLGGIDDLMTKLQDFRPGPGRLAGVLVDHLVSGSKESRIAAGIANSPLVPHVLIVGHPFIDIWAAVKPERLGLSAWPEVPPGVEWKHGVCAALGWRHDSQAQIARAWQHILGKVSSFADLDPALLGRVEELIDFVTQPGSEQSD